MDFIQLLKAVVYVDYEQDIQRRLRKKVGS